MARLIMTTPSGERVTYPITERGLKIGRLQENSIQLVHQWVSRRHAAVELRGREVWLRDLGSSNGVFVNRLRVNEAQLNDGDVIRVGPFELVFEERAAQSIVLDDSRYFPLTSEGREVKPMELSESVIDLKEFFRISNRFNEVLSLRDLLAVVLEEAMRVVPAQRGILMLMKGDELVPMVVLPPSQGDVPVAGSIVRKALDGNEAVLTRDARLDFQGSDSIISAAIRSAICVPLNSGNTRGVILVDSPGRDRFTERDRDTLAALALQASGTLERARLTEEMHRRDLTQQTLVRFLSPNVANAIERYVQQHGSLWEAQELNVTVLFSDVKGFSALSEQLKPAEVQDLLNEYFHVMTDVVFAHQGTLDKYIGDAIMAVFGAPRLPDEPANDQHAVQAVSAAIEMLEAHRQLCKNLTENKRFDIRIGVNSGLAYTGFFGTRQRLEYTAIGDAVNTAQRLESRAEPNTVFIGEDTYRMLPETFAVQEMGLLDLKGKARRVRAFKVLSRT